MHIGIEAHGFWGQSEGQAKATHALILGLSRVDRTNRYTLFFNALRSRAERVREIRRQLPDPRFQIRLIPFPDIRHPAALFFRDRLLWPWIARATGVEVFHSTSYRGIFAKGMRTVLTIHDMAYHEIPEVFTQQTLAYYRSLPQHAARAELVVTDSDSTKHDVMRILGVPESRLRVVHYGVDLEVFCEDVPAARLEAIRERYGVTRPSVLAVGNINPKKNIFRLLSAFRLVTKQVPNARLILVGKATKYGDAVRDHVQALGLSSQVHFTGYVADEDLPLVYRAADVFVFPSLYEGFGLPVLEAMACGTPVVASNATSLPEVAGDASLLVDPTDEEQMGAAIVRLLCDKSLRDDLIDRGRRRVREFSWDAAACKMLQVYQEAVASNP